MPDTPDEHGEDVPLTERFLDLFVFLPTGLVVTVAEELPKLAERGRERLGVQVNSARAVGHFVVAAGHDELKRRSESIHLPSMRREEPTDTAGPEGETGGVAQSAGPPRLRRIPRPPAQDISTVAPVADAGSISPDPSNAPIASAPAVVVAGTAPVSTAAPSMTNASNTASSTSSNAAGAHAPATVMASPRRSAGAHIPEVTSLAIPGFDTLSASQVVQRLDGLSRSELVAARAYETETRGRRTILSRIDQLLDERS